MRWSRFLSAGMAAVIGSSAWCQSQLLGFNKESSDQEHRLEAKFDGYIDAKDQLEWLKRLSAKPHHVGSAYGLSNAEYVRGLFQSWGFDAQIERFYVLFPSPKSRLVELGSPAHYRAKLEEPPVAGDATSSVREDQLPPYNAYSADGDVQAQLVYVNQGMPA